MNWRLIFTLSLFGLAMALATVFWIPGNIEMAFWLPIFIICAWLIAKHAPGKYFLHGFLVSIVNCVWIVAAHALFYDTYMAAHAEEAHAMKQMPMYFHTHPRQAMVLIGPFFGILFGLVLGLFSWIASKMAKK